jgi:hypothetical protein
VKLRRSLIGTIAATALALVGVVALPSPAGAVENGQYYSIRNIRSNMCLDVRDYATNDGAVIQQWACSLNSNQLWKVEMTEGGYYRLRALNSGKCLDIRDASLSNGGALQQWSCGNGWNQQWKDYSRTQGREIKSRYNGKCVDVTGYSTSNGTALQQWDCTQATNQMWTFAFVSVP